MIETGYCSLVLLDQQSIQVGMCSDPILCSYQEMYPYTGLNGTAPGCCYIMDGKLAFSDCGIEGNSRVWGLHGCVILMVHQHASYVYAQAASI